MSSSALARGRGRRDAAAAAAHRRRVGAGGAPAARAAPGPLRAQPGGRRGRDAGAGRRHQAARQGGLDTPVRRPAGLRGRSGDHPRVGAGQLRGDPADGRFRGGRSQRRAAVLPGHVVSRRVQRGAGRMVVAQQVLAARGPAGRRPDARLRGLHGPVPAGRGHDGRLVQPQRHRRGPARPLVRGPAVRRVPRASSSPGWPRPGAPPSICPRPRASWWPAITPNTRP